MFIHFLTSCKLGPRDIDFLESAIGRSIVMKSQHGISLVLSDRHTEDFTVRVIPWTFVSGLPKFLRKNTRDPAICLTSHENFEGSIEPYSKFEFQTNIFPTTKVSTGLYTGTFRYIEYDGPTIFQLDRNARKELNFTVHNGAGYQTELGTLSQGFTDEIL